MFQLLSLTAVIINVINGKYTPSKVDRTFRTTNQGAMENSE